MLLLRCEKFSPDPTTRSLCQSNCKALQLRSMRSHFSTTPIIVQTFLVPQVHKAYLSSVQVALCPCHLSQLEENSLSVQLRLTPRLTATLHTLGAEFVPLTWQPSADSSTLPHTKINTRRRSQRNQGHTLIIILTSMTSPDFVTSGFKVGAAL